MYFRTSRTRIEHTLWQSSMREFGNNVEATDVIEEIQIRTITEITRYTNTMKNMKANKKTDCKICHTNFDNFEEFLIHKNLKHKIKPYVCNFCNAKFVLSAHLNVHKCDNYLRMAIPSTSFEEIPTTSKNSLSINTSRNYKNSTSSSKLVKKSETTVHQNEQSNLTQNVCVTTPNLILQKIKHEPFKCVNCVFATGSETEFLNHLDICNNISKGSSELHQCNLCTKSFKSESALNGHKKFHSNRSVSRRQPPLDKKKEENKNNSSIVKSQNIVSNIENRSQKRKDCNNYYPTRSKVIIHPEPQQQNMIRCNICQKKCLSEKIFEKHLLSHRNVKTSDGKTKINKSTGDKIEKQNISQKKKSFQCPHCNSYCKSKQSLGQHIRQHHSRLDIPRPNLKSKTVKCNYCNSQLTKGNLLRHIKSHHPDINPIQCEYCPMAFKDSRSFKLHKSKFHNFKV